MIKTGKFNIMGAILIVALVLTCYFGWEIVLQERAMMKIIKMGKNDERFLIKPNSRHLEDVAEDWFEGEKNL